MSNNSEMVGTSSAQYPYHLLRHGKASSHARSFAEHAGAQYVFVVFPREFQIAGALLLMVLATCGAQSTSSCQTSITRVLNIFTSFITFPVT